MSDYPRYLKGRPVPDDILAVDPGVSGGFAIGHGGSVKLYPFKTESEFLDLLDGRKFRTAVVEEVPPYVGRAIPGSSAFKLGYNYGFEVGVLRAKGIPVHLVRPQVWQKGLSGLGKLTGAPRKRMLKDNAIRLYPNLGKITLACADALLILHWFEAVHARRT